jgi:hypothetical protein
MGLLQRHRRLCYLVLGAVWLVTVGAWVFVLYAAGHPHYWYSGYFVVLATVALTRTTGQAIEITSDYVRHHRHHHPRTYR